MDERAERSGPPDSVGQVFHGAFVLSLMLLLIAPPAVSLAQLAQIETNIEPTQTVPLDLGTDVNQVGTTTEITGGTRPGGITGTNLFHSFDFFTLGTKDVARFMNDMQRPTNNIFGRVIGGEMSTIDGTLQTNNPLNAADPMNFGTANLWLVNPSGLLLGPNARVEVGGSVSMSTANYLRFDGKSALFDMLSTPASLGPLSVAPVAAFGFTSPAPPAPIEVRGSMLQVPEGEALSLVGGDITIQGGTLEDGTIQAANLRAPGGQLNLVSGASPGAVLVPSFQTGPNINGTSFTRMGTVTLKEGATVDVSGQLGTDADGNPIGGNSGTVLVRGGQLVMDASTILATTVGAVDGASTAIDIQVLQDVTFSNGAVIVTGTSGPGRVGDVHITAGSLTIENRSRITTAISGLGVAGGDVFLNVGRLSLLGSGTLIRSINTSGTDLDGDGTVDATGKGGNITVQGIQGTNSVADSVVLSGGSGITSDAQAGSGGGGRISIRATSLDLNEASFITSSTSSTGIDLNHDGKVDVTGDGGDIVMSVQQLRVVGGATISSNTSDADPTSAAAGGLVTVQGLEGQGSNAGSVLLSGQSAGIFSFSGSGVPGDLTVNAGTLTITNGAVIAAGNSISGPAGQVTIGADSIVISGEGRISSQSFAQDAGKVKITADELTMDNGSIVTSTSSESGGRGGDVVVDAGTMRLTNGASIKSQSETFSTGRAGDITMNVGNLTLENHAEITSSSIGTVPGSGDAGNVTITSSGAFTSNASTIATSAENARGGNIDVTAQSVALSDGTVISASSRSPLLPDGEGNAGNITVRSGSTFVMTNSSMTTEARFASGGQITIITPEMIRVINGQVSTSVAGSEADTAGGNITIDPQFVVLQNGQIKAQAVAGEGGDINIIAGAFLADPSSLVSASSQQGISGVVNIQAQIQNLGEQLTPLSEEFSSAAALLAQQCAARVVDGKFSTFVVTGREGLPVEPGGYLASPSLTAELLGSHLSGRSPHISNAAITGAFLLRDSRPIQLAKVCRMVNGEW
ncbi:MAG: filamentous hemagglutinin N-terminal domain-containing protein [Nitrospira sp.]|nr:filamentous hemagglutinin N-terminal domain-containing protein [Nitrospira sp.]